MLEGIWVELKAALIPMLGFIVGGVIALLVLITYTLMTFNKVRKDDDEDNIC